MKIVFISFLFLASCVETIVVGTIVTGTAIVQNKKESFGKDNDKSIRKNIIDSFRLDRENKYYEKINVNVFEGRVLLTGFTHSDKYKKIAVQKSKVVQTSAEVIDEILVISTAHDLYSSNDSFILSQIWLKLKMESDVISGNYDYSVVGGVVYVIGVSTSQNEMRKVTTTISKIKGVNRVVSYIAINKS
jgi:osmotically-inducible protein OsmY